jgi:phosphate starvation-inducible membrane PsiE
MSVTETAPAAETAASADAVTIAATEPRARPLRQQLRRAFRALLLIAACALTVFWGYAVYAIAAIAKVSGDAADWLAVLPPTLVFLLLTLPALIVASFGRALIFGTLVATAAAVANVWVWQEFLAALIG